MSACIPTYMLASSFIGGGMNWWEAILTVFLGHRVRRRLRGTAALHVVIDHVLLMSRLGGESRQFHRYSIRTPKRSSIPLFC
jgi:hypothetical protein